MYKFSQETDCLQNLSHLFSTKLATLKKEVVYPLSDGSHGICSLPESVQRNMRCCRLFQQNGFECFSLKRLALLLHYMLVPKEENMEDDGMTSDEAHAQDVGTQDIQINTIDESDGIIIETGNPLDIILQQVLNHGLIAVNAPAGSLMLVDQKQGILQVKARLGPPRHRRSEPVYRISGQSIASLVVRQKQSYVCLDIDKDQNFTPGRSGRSFSSLLSAPIIHKDEVIAVINADSPEKGYFTQEHMQQLERVARAVAGPVAERISILDAIAAVGLELMRLPKSGGVEQVLLKVAEAAVRSLGADVVTLYQYNQKTDQFLVEGKGPTVAGNLRDPAPMRRRIYNGDVPHTVVKSRRSGFYSDVGNQDFLVGAVDRPDDKPRLRFWEREQICSMAALLLPASAAENPHEEVVGVMFANYRSNHNFNIDERTALETFADYATVAILNARHEEQTRTEKTREAQLAMVQSISSSFAHRMSDLAGTSRVATQFLRRSIPSRDRKARRYLQRIEEDAEVLFKMATRITAPFRTGSASEEPVDVVGIVDRELARLTKEDSKVAVVKDFPQKVPLVRSIGFQLEQVIRDLLNNAMEAMEPVKQKRLGVSIHTDAANGRLQIQIKDNGTGIPAEIQDTLFSPCVTTKEGNLGIGLWWSRHFLKSSDGDLRLEWTELGKGTSFVVDLQADMGRQPRPVASSKPQRDILVVEDSPAWRETLIDTIQHSLKCSCEVTRNYHEAADALAGTDFKLAIMDVRLGADNTDGLKLLAEIDRTNQATKVIIISNYAEHEIAVRDRGRILGFVRKGDFKVEDFVRLVRRGIGSRKSVLKKKHLQNRVSCFISYSTKDEEFARRLHADLRAGGVGCWFAPQDVQGGRKLDQQIYQAIRDYERLLLILSSHSMNSEWVKTEIAEARKREVDEKRRVLFPVRLVDFDVIREWRCFDPDTGKDSAREIREYFIPDFSNWRDRDTYQKSLQRLLEGLQGAKAKAVTAS
ncbi:MAG TPA: GAF domain-containing protein [Candidatus Angelobacter sp.]|nr:GAF domain-containing protein [Candidatus Angelobacter sp.]